MQAAKVTALRLFACVCGFINCYCHKWHLQADRCDIFCWSNKIWNTSSVLWNHQVSLFLLGARRFKEATNNTTKTQWKAERDDAEVCQLHQNAAYRKGGSFLVIVIITILFSHIADTVAYAKMKAASNIRAMLYCSWLECFEFQICQRIILYHCM